MGEIFPQGGIMDYYFEEWCIGGTDRIGKPFDDATFSLVNEAMERFQNLSNEIDFFTIIFYNLQSFLNTPKIQGINGKPDLAMINSCFTNFLNSFYTWKCFNKDEFEQFDALHTQKKDKYIFYQFGDRLRNYVAHNAFAITSSSYDSLREQFYGVINPRELLNRDKWTGKVKDWLQQNEKKSKGIDAYSFAIEFYKVCNELQCELWLSKVKQVRSDLLFISNLFPDGYYNIYNICLASQGQAVNVGIGQIIVHFLLKAVQFYPDFVPEYIMGKF